MIVPSASAPTIESSGFLLAAYAQHLGYDECSFFGVRRFDGLRRDSSGCDTAWTQAQRRNLAWYLCEAQTELEDVTKWPLSTKYFVDEEIPAYQCPDYLKWCKVQAIGRQAFSDVELGVVVDHQSDPATVTVAAAAANLTAVSAENVRVYDSGSNYALTPSAIRTLADGRIEISIPRCRMVSPNNFNTSTSDMVKYSDLSAFIDNVDVKIEYVDDTPPMLLCGPTCCGRCGCGQTEKCEVTGVAACTYINDHMTSLVTAKPLVRQGCKCSCRSRKLVISYAAGDKRAAKDSILAIRWLAHAKMPRIPCSCDMLREIYAADRRMPEMISTKMTSLAFGLPRSGAYSAYWWAFHKRGIRLLSFS